MVRSTLLPVFTSIVALSLGVTLAGAAQAQDAAFYKGKRLTIGVGGDAGGTYDANARLLALHIGRHLEGNPTAIVRNRPGAAGLRLTNYMYAVAPRDGTEMAVGNQSLPMSQVMNEPGVEFDARQFSWIGSSESGVNVAFTWHTSPVKTIQDAMTQELVIGATGGGSSTVYYPLMMNELLGTKFKVVRGYPSSGMNLAIERGEVQGRAALTWASLRTNAAWLEEKKVNIILQIGARRSPDLPDVPLMSELARNEDDRRLLEFVSAAPSVGRPFFLPPGVPNDRVRAMQAAFDATMTDKVFLTEAREANVDISPTSGEDLRKIILLILDTPRAVIDRAEAFMKR